MTRPKNDDPASSDRENIPEDLKSDPDSSEALNEILKLYPKGKQSMVKMMLGLTSSAVKFVSKSSGMSSRFSKTILGSPERKRLIEEAGASLRDFREVAGLTVTEVSDAIQLPDQSLLTAVENGTATLSFELILRLAALLARHDPVPFIIRFTRTYNPEVWSLLEDWGLGRLPLHIEREREFINIYRRHDSARKLSDEEFDHVLKFTRTAFEMALAFALDKNESAQSKEESEPAD